MKSFGYFSQVHVIRVTNAATAAMLEIDGTGLAAKTRLALILDADAVVKWSVRLLDGGVEPQFNHSIIVSSLESVEAWWLNPRHWFLILAYR